MYPRHSESNRLGRAGSRRSSLPVLQSKCASSSSIAPSRARWGGLVEKILSSALGALRPENRFWGPRTSILGASWIAFLSNPHPLHDIHLPICGKEIIMNFVKARRPLFISNGGGFRHIKTTSSCRHLRMQVTLDQQGDPAWIFVNGASSSSTRLSVRPALLANLK